jgi:LacI family transcriptional regulator, galactose operon repressor
MTNGAKTAGGRVAAVAGGGTSTPVRRAFRDRSKSVSAATAVRRRNLDANKESADPHGLNARSRSVHRTRVIGLFATPQTHLGESLNGSLIDGLVETLLAAGYEIFFGLTPTRYAKSILPMWSFDGAVLTQTCKHEIVRELDTRRIPYVCLNERIGRPVAHVLADDAMGMDRAVSHLKQLGHKRIAYANVRMANTASHYSVNDRHKALLEAAKNQGIELSRSHDQPFNSAEPFIRTAIVEEGATAIITYDHRLGVRILGAAYEMGLRVPQDFSLLCFNDVFPVSTMTPALTAVAIAGREMGRLAAEQLLNYLLSAQQSFGKEIRVPEDLIVRGSTGPPKN